MIHYQRGCFPGIFKRVLTLSGSVFPRAACVALPNALGAGLLHMVLFSDYSPINLHPGDVKVMSNNAIWAGFTSLLGFIIVFRTSQAQNRFSEAVTHMQTIRATWAQSASALCAFCRCSKAGATDIMIFKHTLLRLLSILHALVLSELEDHDASDVAENIMAFHVDVFDPSGLDAESLKVLRDSNRRVEMVYQWIQSLIVDNIGNGVLAVPPPILSRSFQELGNGMVAFQQAWKISQIPFPFPYTQTCDTLLFLHWVLSPILAVQWIDNVWFCGLFSFVQVLILWALNFIAVEMENPFGYDYNDLDFSEMQEQINSMLTMLLREGIDRVPKLSSQVLLNISQFSSEAEERKMTKDSTLFNSWADLGDGIQPRESNVVTKGRNVAALKRLGTKSLTDRSSSAKALKDRKAEKREDSCCPEEAAGDAGASYLQACDAEESPLTDQGNSFQGRIHDEAPRGEHDARVIPREDPQQREESTLEAIRSASSRPAVAACRDASSREGSPLPAVVAEDGGSLQQAARFAI